MDKHHAAGKIEVNGIVQGVGFRPFIYNLALRHGLKGEVSNTTAGVAIVVEGPADHIDAFTADISAAPPPLAHVVEVSRRAIPVTGYAAFTIVQSKVDTASSTLISPDVSICDDCRKELFDPNDRRYRYPFINCTNCGPRYTIIDGIPYDRPKTSMKHFEMCPQCQEEYDDPLDRRFHAQPNACPVCGPHVSLLDRNRNPVDGADPIRETARLLRQGRIIAIKGLGGFHLAVDAVNAKAVRRLRSKKQLEEKAGIDAFVWDGAPSHRGNAVKALGAILVIQPPYSPELNPAERVFEAIRAEVEGKIYATIADKHDAV